MTLLFFVFFHVEIMSSEVKLTTGTEKGISMLDRRMLVAEAAPPMSNGTDL